MSELKTEIARLEERMGKKINQHLGFVGDLEGHGELYVKYSDKEAEHGFDEGAQYLGEWSKDSNKPHGRGILIDSDGDIRIGYFNNGDDAPGNYLTILSDGDVDVGECYLKGGESCYRGTFYHTDGTSEEFDWWLTIIN